MENIINKRRRLTKVYIGLTISALLYTLGVQVFVQTAHIFPSGLGAFAVMPSFIWPQLTSYVTWIYLGANVPLIIIFWKKNSRKFMYRSLYFLITQALFGALFIIPAINNEVQDILQTGASTNLEMRQQLWPILVLAILGSIFIGASIGFSWKLGGSTGGTDIIAFYWSTKKKSDVGMILFLVSILCVSISFIFSVAFSSDMRKTWVMSLFSSLVYILFSVFIVNRIYPKYKKVLLTVVSDKNTKISEQFRSSNFHHAWQFGAFISGMTGKKKTKITTIVYLLECRDLIRKIKQVDENAWITIQQIQDIYGHLNTSFIEDIH